MTTAIENATDNKPPAKEYEFIVFFKRHDGKTWANAHRMFKATNTKNALKKFEDAYRDDIVPPRWSKVAKTMAIGEIQTVVKPVYV